MERFKDYYVIGRPYASERTGYAGRYQTTEWFDTNGHLTGSETNGDGDPSGWTGRTHGEYAAAMREVAYECGIDPDAV